MRQRPAGPEALPADLAACRGGAVVIAQAASGFSARLDALPPGDVVSGVADHLRTLGELRARAQRLAADVDARSPSSIGDDASWIDALGWAANMSLAFEPLT